MAEIEKMAALCMRDLDDEDMGDEDLDDDEDLLAELNEVLEDDMDSSPPGLPPAVTPTAPKVNRTPQPASPASPAASGASGLESRLMERIEMYTTAISNAKAAGETSKVRRYDRGLKTLQSMLTSAKKGKPVNEEEMPPPVALGAPSKAAGQPAPFETPEPPAPAPVPSPPVNQRPQREAPPPATNTKPVHLSEMFSFVVFYFLLPSPCSELKQAVLARQREYKLAAIHAKQNGAIDQAKQYYLTAKVPSALSSLPPPPGRFNLLKETLNLLFPALPVTFTDFESPAQVATSDLPAPSSVGEALQQRMDIYKSAAEGAKSKGDDRKARMHQRIVKQYQDAIRAHKAGRPVSLADLPVPPGCPPLQGSEGGQQQSFIGALETAMKIANQDEDAEDEDEGGQREAAKSPAPQTPGGSSAPKLGQKGLFILLFHVGLHTRNKTLHEDMTGAAQHLRHAKGLDPMVEAAKSGLPVDITKIPNAPVNEEDFVLARSRTSPVSPRSSEKYHGLLDLLRKQYEKCLHLSHQFTSMGSVSEALKFEKLSGECMKDIELLKDCYAKGHPVPKCRTEERTLNSVKSYPNLTPNDLVLYVIRGVNLPAPSGVSANDLDASVKFEFPFPSSEEAQRDKTNTMKNTNSPEFKEQFKLNISRTHRGFKRVVQSKGIKFEVIHKGGLFKTDKVVGTAHLKLEALENHCEIREIIEVMDGRKATGGKLEVRVKIREPLSGVDLQPVTEKWVVLDPVSPLSPPERQRDRSSHPNTSPPQYKLHSFSLLNYDKDRLERKMAEYRKNRRDPPPDLIHQHKEVTHRLHWQKSQLERASPALLSGDTKTSKKKNLPLFFLQYY
uniref:Coiled-coil and C2 domain-containing protein 1B n=1 Tax=Salarias fasciatus TaxID=181472 RepID=A0A672HCN5_SALFA